MKKEKDIRELKLSEFAEQCLKEGVIPFIKFLDKGEFETGYAQKVPVEEQTPVYVLLEHIAMLQKFISRLEKREDIDPNAEQSKLDEIVLNLKERIKVFNAAILTLQKSET